MARVKRQVEAPGFESKSIKAVDDAAERYQELRVQRRELKKQEDAAHAALLTQMEKHSVEVYRDKTASPPLIVNIAKKTMAKVKEDKPKKARRSKGLL